MRLKRGGSRVEVEQIESRLAVLWAEAFEIGTVASDADFFALGGDSLKGLEIIAAVEEEFGVAVGVGVFATARSVSALAQLIARERSARDRTATRQPAGKRSSEYPLSFAQEQIWRYCLDERAARLYLTRAEIAVDGVVDEAALRGSVARMVDRHAILRTVFVDRAGAPAQRVLPAMTVPTTLIDLSGALDAPARVSELAQAAMSRRFDLRRGPLLELTVLRLGPAKYHLILVFHHIVFDGHSVRLFWLELGAQHDLLVSDAKTALTPPPRIGLGEFAIWQRAQLNERAEQLNWWLATLHDAPSTLELPFERKLREPACDPSEGFVRHPLSAELLRRCEALAGDIGVTFYVFWLAAYATQLAADTGREDFALGVYVIGRPLPGLRTTLGLFTHLVALRLRFEPEICFREWVTRVRDAVLDIGRHGDVPWEFVADELARAGSTPPEITTIFSVIGDGKPARFGRSAVTTVRRRDRLDAMPWGFSLWAEHYPGDGEQMLRANFDAHRYEPAAVTAFLARLEALVEIASAAPETPIARLDIAAAGARSA